MAVIVDDSYSMRFKESYFKRVLVIREWDRSRRHCHMFSNLLEKRRKRKFHVYLDVLRGSTYCDFESEGPWCSRLEP